MAAGKGPFQRGRNPKKAEGKWPMGLRLLKNGWEAGKGCLWAGPPTLKLRGAGKGRSLIFGDFEGFYRLFIAAEEAMKSRKGWIRARFCFADGSAHEILMLRVDRKKMWKKLVRKQKGLAISLITSENGTGKSLRNPIEPERNRGVPALRPKVSH